MLGIIVSSCVSFLIYMTLLPEGFQHAADYFEIMMIVQISKLYLPDYVVHCPHHDHYVLENWKNSKCSGNCFSVIQKVLLPEAQQNAYEAH